MPEPNWTLEWVKIAQGLLGTLLGGLLVLLAGWLADRRKQVAEKSVQDQREKALLTAMFAVRNHIAERLNEWAEDGLTSRLEPLRTAQAYVHRLIDKAPGESESLMIAIVEIGLKLDTLIGSLDRSLDKKSSADLVSYARMMTKQVEELEASLEQFDIISGRTLSLITEEELTGFNNG